MYQRIILYPISDNNLKIGPNEFKQLTGEGATGYGLLPPVLNINNQTEYNKEQEKDISISFYQSNFASFNERYYSKKSGEIMSVTDSQNFNGIIGNKSYEFFIDFYSTSFNNKSSFKRYTEILKSYLADSVSDITPSTIELYTYIFNDDFIAISRKFLFDKFYIFELNDYSYQAMTMNNYDYDLKAFFKEDPKSLTIDSDPEYKFPHAISTVIKSYTHKKAWLLLDKTIIDQNSLSNFVLTKIVVDFKYKFNNFKNFYSDWNISGLFNTIENSSPYYDFYGTRDNNENTISVLNKQSEYFYNENISKGTEFKDKIDIYSSRVIDNDLILDSSIQKFQPLLFNIKIDQKYLNNLSYEVYKYDEKQIKGTRLLSGVIPESEKCKFEVFPIPSNMVHYLYKLILVSGTKPKDIDITDIGTVNQIRKLLNSKNIYLSLYDIENMTTFIINDNIYVDMYIPIQYSDKINKKEFTDSDKFNLKIHKIELPENIKSNGSFYDPINITSDGEYDPNQFIPYFESDSYIPQKISNTPYVININNTKFDVLQYREGAVKDFDIRVLKNKTDNIQINFNDEPVQIDLKNIIDLRKLYTEKNTEKEIETFAEKQYEILCQNLNLLITNKENGTNSKYINMTDCLFSYIKLNKPYDLNNISYMKIIKKYQDGTSYIYYAKALSNNSNEYIIFPSEDNLNEIELFDNQNVFKVY